MTEKEADREAAIREQVAEKFSDYTDEKARAEGWDSLDDLIETEVQDQLHPERVLAKTPDLSGDSYGLDENDDGPGPIVDAGSGITGTSAPWANPKVIVPLLLALVVIIVLALSIGGGDDEPDAAQIATEESPAEEPPAADADDGAASEEPQADDDPAEPAADGDQPDATADDGADATEEPFPAVPDGFYGFSPLEDLTPDLITYVSDVWEGPALYSPEPGGPVGMETVDPALTIVDVASGLITQDRVAELFATGLEGFTLIGANPVAEDHVWVARAVGGPQDPATSYQTSVWALTAPEIDPFTGQTDPFTRFPEGNAASAWFFDHTTQTLENRDPTAQFGLVDSGAFALLGPEVIVVAIPESELRPTGPGYLTIGEFGRTSPGTPSAEDPAAYSLADIVFPAYRTPAVPLCVAGDADCSNRFEVAVDASRGLADGDIAFFATDDIDAIVRMLDGCTPYGTYWLSVAAATDVPFTLTVTDTVAGESRTWDHPGGGGPAIIDTAAFATCP